MYFKRIFIQRLLYYCKFFGRLIHLQNYFRGLYVVTRCNEIPSQNGTWAGLKSSDTNWNLLINITPVQMHCIFMVKNKFVGSLIVIMSIFVLLLRQSITSGDIDQKGTMTNIIHFVHSFEYLVKSVHLWMGIGSANVVLWILNMLSYTWT